MLRVLKKRQPGAGHYTEVWDVGTRQWLPTVIRWAHDNLPRSPSADQYLCLEAAKHGDIVVVRWARSHGYEWHTLTCATAAARGHIGFLKAVRAHGCPWDSNTTYYAMINGHKDILYWAYANGCPLPPNACYLARQNCPNAILRWLATNGCTCGGELH
ncbi:MAG: hypothetical protein KGL39_27665 [Patescibacteria group bacterium]|nr:hypothetical protein [Patescibacteria group bacterium]